MDCYFKYSFKSRTKDSINLETFFQNFFLNGLITCRQEFEKKLAQQSSFEIPAQISGRLIQGDSTFSTYVVENVTTETFKKYMHNFQIFLKFFIETGSYIDDSDEMWKIIFMIEEVNFSESERRQKNMGWLYFFLPLL